KCGAPGTGIDGSAIRLSSWRLHPCGDCLQLARFGRTAQSRDLSARHSRARGNHRNARDHLCRDQHRCRRAASADRSPHASYLGRVLMASTIVPAVDPAEALRRAQQGKGYWARVWQRLRNDKVTLVTITVLLILVIMTVFAPWFTVHDP